MGSDLYYDVFLSYSHAEAEATRPLAEALRQSGIRVWMDESDIPDFASITRSIIEGLACSKVLVAYYSRIYPLRRPCQWELTAAFLAAQKLGDPRRRVLVVNPGPSADHIYPVELRDALFLRAPESEEDLARVVRRLTKHVGKLQGVLGQLEVLRQPAWHGSRGLGSSRFVGRASELWQIHSALHAADVPIITGVQGVSGAQLRGLGGSGKSLLAEEYARRFSAAFPGGVFWLRAYGYDAQMALSAEEREMERQRQVLAFAADLGISADGRQLDEIEGEFGRRIAKRGLTCLWVIDDLPAGLDTEELRRWWAPDALARTLITTRSREYGAFAKPIDLGMLAPDDAYQLLTASRAPQGDEEEAAARGLVEDLGGHALAIDVAGGALSASAGLQTFSEFRLALADPGEDELEFTAELADALPTGHDKNIASTLLRSIEQLDEAGRDFLRLASVLAVAPIPVTLVQAVIKALGDNDEKMARRRTLTALSRADSLSLTETPDEDLRTVHTLISRTIRWRDPRSERRDELRTAAASILLDNLGRARAPQDYSKLQDHVPHARELAQRASTDEEIELLARVGGYDVFRGAYHSAVSLLRKQVAALQLRFGANHAKVFDAMNEVAGALELQGNYVASQKLHERVLTFRHEKVGKEHPDTLTSMNNLGSALFQQGQYEDAKKIFKKVIEISWRLLSPLHPHTLWSIANLAMVCPQTRDFAAALELEEQILEIRRLTKGPEDNDTLTSMNNLASLRQIHSDTEGARRLWEEALEIRRRIFGDEHPLTLAVQNNLAQLMAADGDLAEAQEIQERVLDASRRVLGPEHPDTLRPMSNLASTLWARGKKKAARELLVKVLTIRRQVLGVEHPDTRLIEDQLAEWSSNFGRAEQQRVRLTRKEDQPIKGGMTDALEPLKPQPVRRELGAEPLRQLEIEGEAEPVLEEVIQSKNAQLASGAQNLDLDTAAVLQKQGIDVSSSGAADTEDTADERVSWVPVAGVGLALAGVTLLTVPVVQHWFRPFGYSAPYWQTSLAAMAGGAASFLAGIMVGLFFQWSERHRRRELSERRLSIFSYTVTVPVAIAVSWWVGGGPAVATLVLTSVCLGAFGFLFAAAEFLKPLPESHWREPGSEQMVVNAELGPSQLSEGEAAEPVLEELFQSINLQLASRTKELETVLEKLAAVLQRQGLDVSSPGLSDTEETAVAGVSWVTVAGYLALGSALVGVTLLTALTAQLSYRALGYSPSYWPTSLGALAGGATSYLARIVVGLFLLWSARHRRRGLNERWLRLFYYTVIVPVAIAVSWWVGGGPAVVTLVITPVSLFALRFLFMASKGLT